jgi:hypothetical protein
VPPRRPDTGGRPGTRHRYVADDGSGLPALGVEVGQFGRGGGGRVEQGGGQAEQFRHLLSGLQHGQGEGGRHSPQQRGSVCGCLAPQRVGREVTVGQAQHPRSQRGDHIDGQGLLPGPEGAVRGVDQRPGAALRQRHRPQLRIRVGRPAAVGAPTEERRVLHRVRHVAGEPVHRHHTQLTPEHPRRDRRPLRTLDPVEQQPQRLRSQPGLSLRDRGCRRRLPPTPTRTSHRQRVDQLRQHQTVARPHEQPARQHEQHHQPGRQTSVAHLPHIRRVDHLIDQVVGERPRQHTDRDPIRQPLPSRPSLTRKTSHRGQSDTCRSFNEATLRGV